MFATVDSHPALIQARLTLAGLLAAFVDPLAVIASLWGIAAYLGESFDGHYMILAMIAFSLSFPGSPHWKAPLRTMYRDILLGWGLLAALLIFFGYATGMLSLFPAHLVTLWLAAAPLTLLGSHHLVRYALPRILAAEGVRRTAVIVGSNELGRRLALELRRSADRGGQPIGFFDDRRDERLGDLAGCALLGTFGDLAGYIKEHRVDVIYITLPMASQPRIVRLLDDLRDTTASIYFVPDIFLTDLIQGRMDSVGGIPLVSICETPFIGLNGMIKRLSDILLASAILLLISPLMLAIAIGVKRSSPGPVLFRQRRYGLDGREIMVYKFRSMTVCEDGAVIRQATRNDNRVTPFGAFLRKTSLDELPQFINVLQGRMSVVGPRPHAVAHNEQYRKLIKGYMIRHKVKPGITGWAQVNGCRGETEALGKMQERINYDLEYLRHWSLKLDLMIVARTVLVVLRDRHAY
ncbi:MAG TPA: undecaprenyl-phosphate glucose phosphotransferase [Rhodocyclaceae bacterium]|nr:undecaprenyl-phosphate glucose phosphotransferase [Rhodocyclaceae bacterium]